jgi:hypothetical protein
VYVQEREGGSLDQRFEIEQGEETARRRATTRKKIKQKKTKTKTKGRWDFGFLQNGEMSQRGVFTGWREGGVRLFYFSLQCGFDWFYINSWVCCAGGAQGERKRETLFPSRTKNEDFPS